jgi:hypothetical protein
MGASSSRCSAARRRRGRSRRGRSKRPCQPAAPPTAAAPPTRVTRSAEGLVIETAGTSVRVATREWLMPLGRRRSGVTVRELMVCPKCNASRDALYWVDGEWCCRGQGCGNLSHASRHQQRWCPAIRRRAKLLRKLARVSPRGLRARLLRAQIAQQEAAMLANVKQTNRDLTKRSRRHAGHRRAHPE